jgi:hypothetical protein
MKRPDNIYDALSQLQRMFTGLDDLYIDISKRGIAAHEAGNKVRQRQMEAIAHHVYEARREIVKALDEALRPTEGSGERYE